MAVFEIPYPGSLPKQGTNGAPRQIQTEFALAKSTSLGNFIARNTSLTTASKAFDVVGSFVKVLVADLLMNPFTPKFETRGLEFSPHQGHHIGFSQPKLGKDGLERRPIFPSHFNDQIDLGRTQGLGYFW
jgi:hypothetical protein